MHDSMTFAQAIAKMDLSPDDDHGQRALVSIEAGPGRKPVRHQTVTAYGDRAVADYAGSRHLYTTLAKYAPGTITEFSGRTKENATSCDMFMFDSDLKDYLNTPHSVLETWPHEELDRMIQALVLQVQEIAARVGIPLNRIDSTGYGCASYSYIRPEDRHRVLEIDAIHKRLVERINTEAGGALVDPAVSDANTRFMRLVGSFNHKGPIPRRVYTAVSAPGANALDAYPVESTPIRRAPTRTVTEKRLTDDVLDEIVLAVSEDYREGQRNAISFGLPAMLYKAGVPRDQARTVVERISIDDEEVANRISACERTYNHGEAGQPVTGYRQLGNCLSPRVRDFLDNKLNRFRQSVIVAGIEEEAPLPQSAPGSYENVYDPAPAECFYGLAGEYRNLVSPCTSGPDAYHLASFLTYAGATLGRRAWSYQARKHYPALYTILIGDTGSAHKDTCADKAREFFDLQHKLANSVVTFPDYIVLEGVSTPEGLLSFMHSNERKRIMIHTSEFDSLLTKAASDPGHGLVPMLTRVWDGKESEDLPTRTNPIRVAHPWVSLLSNITPDVLQTEINPGYIRSGFANRVLWVFGSGKGRIPDPPEMDGFEARRLISEILHAFQCAAPKHKETQFTRSPLAKQRFDAWDEELYERARALNNDERHLSQRLEAQAIRIATLFAASDGTNVVTDYHLDPAIAFVEWQFENVRRESRLWGSNDDAKLGEAVMRLLRTKSMSHQEVAETLPRWGTFLINRTLKSLVEADRVLYNFDTQLYTVNAHTRRSQEAPV